MKYAKREFERRFLLGSVPPSLPTQYLFITDAYFVGTTLRLRQVIEPDGITCTYKLTQKRKDPEGQMWITNTYLSETEVTLLRSLPAVILKKRRYHIARGATSQAIDIVEGFPEKIVLLEMEGDSAADIRESPSGFDIVREVTHEEEYTGYALAQRVARQKNA